MGGGINVTMGPDQTTIGGEVLSEFGPQYVALVAEVTQKPHKRRDARTRVLGLPSAASAKPLRLLR